MTPAIVTLDLAKRQAWARGELGLTAGATPEEIKAAIWEHLEAANLTPSAAQRQAIRLLCDPQAPGARPKNGCDACLEAREDELMDKTEGFFAQFFRLSCAARREQLAQLLAAAEAYPRIRLRLLSCERGLAVEPSDLEGPNVEPFDPQEKLLAQRVCLLFLLKPGDRTSQRRRWLAEMQGDWKAAIERFRRKHARLAALDVDFLRGLETSLNNSTARNAAGAQHAKVAPALIGVAKPASAPASPLRLKTTNAANSPTVSKRNVGWLAVLAVCFVLRAVFSNLVSSSSQDHPTIRAPQPDIPNQRELDNILRQLQDSRESDLLRSQPKAEESGEEILRRMYRPRPTATSPRAETDRLRDNWPPNFLPLELARPTDHDQSKSGSRELAPPSPRGSVP